MAQNRKINPWDFDENGMNEYEMQTTKINRSVRIQEWRSRRSADINDVPGYFTGDRVHHLRSIQMYDLNEWDDLFGRVNLNERLVDYAQASFDWIYDAQTHLFAGQMEVSLLMQENVCPGIHAAIFIVHLTPHRRSYDGHAIRMDFGEGSKMHQHINRLFDITNGRAIIRQATEYQILGYLANDGEAMDLLYDFNLPEFAPMRFSFVESDPADPADPAYDVDCRKYVENQDAGNLHRWHEIADDFNDDEANQANG